MVNLDRPDQAQPSLAPWVFPNFFRRIKILTNFGEYLATAHSDRLDAAKRRALPLVAGWFPAAVTR